MIPKANITSTGRTRANSTITAPRWFLRTDTLCPFRGTLPSLGTGIGQMRPNNITKLDDPRPNGANGLATHFELRLLRWRPARVVSRGHRGQLRVHSELEQDAPDMASHCRQRDVQPV